MPTEGTATEEKPETAPAPRPWLTPKEAAIALDVNIVTIYRMIYADGIRHRVKPGAGKKRSHYLIDPSHVDELNTIHAVHA